MFEKRNQDRFDELKREFENIKKLILDIIEGKTARLGTGIDKVLLEIDEKLNNLDSSLDSIGLIWEVQNSKLKEFRKETKYLTILFSKLITVTQERILLAQKSGKTYIVPIARVKKVQNNWNGISKNLKIKVDRANGVREFFEQIMAGKDKVVGAIDDFFTITGADYAEDKIVNERAEDTENKAERDEMIDFVAKGFKVDRNAVCNLPKDILESMAKNLGWKNSANLQKGKEPGDE